MKIWEKIKGLFSKPAVEGDIFKAAERGDKQLVERLLASRPLLCNIRSDEGGNTPLHIASAHGHINVVEYLLQYGVDVTIKNDAGKTAAQLAMEYRAQKEQKEQQYDDKFFQWLEAEPKNAKSVAKEKERIRWEHDKYEGDGWGRLAPSLPEDVMDSQTLGRISSLSSVTEESEEASSFVSKYFGNRQSGEGRSL